MQPEFHSGAVTRPLSAILQLAMMGCPALRARGELAAGACAPVLEKSRTATNRSRDDRFVPVGARETYLHANRFLNRGWAVACARMGAV